MEFKSVFMVNLSIKLPDSFLDEEIRNGYTITTETKKVWAVEIDLLNELQKVCEKYDLKYYASGGTCIGAARDGGFIPWDDDIDLQMFRKDFDRLCEIAPSEFKYPYFFQVESTDPLSLRGHGQLRNSATTALLNEEIGRTLPYNRGIFIDIFPLDDIPDEPEDLAKFQKRIDKYSKPLERIKGLTLFYKPTHGIKGIIKHLAHIILLPFKKPLLQHYYFKREAIFKTYLNSNNKEVAELHWPKIRAIAEKSNYSDTITIPFEFTEIQLPSGYDELLKSVYGDWRTPAKAPSIHGGLYFNTDKSYKDN